LLGRRVTIALTGRRGIDASDGMQGSAMSGEAALRLPWANDWTSLREASAAGAGVGGGARAGASSASAAAASAEADSGPMGAAALTGAVSRRLSRPCGLEPVLASTAHHPALHTVAGALRPAPDETLLAAYPWQGRGGIALRFTELRRLQHGAWLNDNAVDLAQQQLAVERLGPMPALARRAFLHGALLLSKLGSDDAAGTRRQSLLRTMTNMRSAFSHRTAVLAACRHRAIERSAEVERAALAAAPSDRQAAYDAAAAAAAAEGARVLGSVREVLCRAEQLDAEEEAEGPDAFRGATSSSSSSSSSKPGFSDFLLRAAVPVAEGDDRSEEDRAWEYGLLGYCSARWDTTDATLRRRLPALRDVPAASLQAATLPYTRADPFHAQHLILPYNDNSHWSLVVVANPALVLPRPEQVAEAAEAMEQRAGEVLAIGRSALDALRPSPQQQRQGRASTSTRAKRGRVVSDSGSDDDDATEEEDDDDEPATPAGRRPAKGGAASGSRGHPGSAEAEPKAKRGRANVKLRTAAARSGAQAAPPIPLKRGRAGVQSPSAVLAAASAAATAASAAETGGSPAWIPAGRGTDAGAAAAPSAQGADVRDPDGLDETGGGPKRVVRKAQARAPALALTIGSLVKAAPAEPDEEDIDLSDVDEGDDTPPATRSAPKPAPAPAPAPAKIVKPATGADGSITGAAVKTTAWKPGTAAGVVSFLTRLAGHARSPAAQGRERKPTGQARVRLPAEAVAERAKAAAARRAQLDSRSSDSDDDDAPVICIEDEDESARAAPGAPAPVRAARLWEEAELPGAIAAIARLGSAAEPGAEPGSARATPGDAAERAGSPDAADTIGAALRDPDAMTRLAQADLVVAPGRGELVVGGGGDAGADAGPGAEAALLAALRDTSALDGGITPGSLARACVRLAELHAVHLCDEAAAEAHSCLEPGRTAALQVLALADVASSPAREQLDDEQLRGAAALAAALGGPSGGERAGAGLVARACQEAAAATPAVPPSVRRAQAAAERAVAAAKATGLLPHAALAERVVPPDSGWGDADAVAITGAVEDAAWCERGEVTRSVGPSSALALCIASGQDWSLLGGAGAAPGALEALAWAAPLAVIADAVRHGVGRVMRADLAETGDTEAALGRAEEATRAHYAGAKRAETGTVDEAAPAAKPGPAGGGRAARTRSRAGKPAGRASAARPAPPPPRARRADDFMGAAEAVSAVRRSDALELGDASTARRLLEHCSPAEREAWAAVALADGPSRFFEPDVRVVGTLGSDAQGVLLALAGDTAREARRHKRQVASLLGLIATDLGAEAAVRRIVSPVRDELNGSPSSSSSSGCHGLAADSSPAKDTPAFLTEAGSRLALLIRHCASAGRTGPLSLGSVLLAVRASAARVAAAAVLVDRRAATVFLNLGCMLHDGEVDMGSALGWASPHGRAAPDAAPLVPEPSAVSAALPVSRILASQTAPAAGWKISGPRHAASLPAQPSVAGGFTARPTKHVHAPSLLLAGAGSAGAGAAADVSDTEDEDEDVRAIETWDDVTRVDVALLGYPPRWSPMAAASLVPPLPMAPPSPGNGAKALGAARVRGRAVADAAARWHRGVSLANRPLRARMARLAAHGVLALRRASSLGATAAALLRSAQDAIKTALSEDGARKREAKAAASPLASANAGGRALLIHALVRRAQNLARGRLVPDGGALALLVLLTKGGPVVAERSAADEDSSPVTSSPSSSSSSSSVPSSESPSSEQPDGADKPAAGLARDVDLAAAAVRALLAVAAAHADTLGTATVVGGRAWPGAACLLAQLTMTGLNAAAVELGRQSSARGRLVTAAQQAWAVASKHEVPSLVSSLNSLSLSGAARSVVQSITARLRALLPALPRASKDLLLAAAGRARGELVRLQTLERRCDAPAAAVVIGLDSLNSHNTSRPARLVRAYLEDALVSRYLPRALRSAALGRLALGNKLHLVRESGAAGVIRARGPNAAVRSRARQLAKEVHAAGATAEASDAAFLELGRQVYCPLWVTAEALPKLRAKHAPQQDNGCDCGVWTGVNARAWAAGEGLPHVTAEDIKDKLGCIVRADWVPRGSVPLHREELAALVWRSATGPVPDGIGVGGPGIGVAATGICDPGSAGTAAARPPSAGPAADAKGGDTGSGATSSGKQAVSADPGPAGAGAASTASASAPSSNGLAASADAGSAAVGDAPAAGAAGKRASGLAVLAQGRDLRRKRRRSSDASDDAVAVTASSRESSVGAPSLGSLGPPSGTKRGRTHKADEADDDDDDDAVAVIGE